MRKSRSVKTIDTVERERERERATFREVGFIYSGKNRNKKIETRKRGLSGKIKPNSRSPSFLRVN